VGWPLLPGRSSSEAGSLLTGDDARWSASRALACREALFGSAHQAKGHARHGPRPQEIPKTNDAQADGQRAHRRRGPRGRQGVLRRARDGAGRPDAGRGAVGGQHRRARRRPCRHRDDADPGRPRPGRADEVPHAAGGQGRAAERAGEHAGHPSTTSTTSLPACAVTVASSSARSRSTRTATGSASCVARRASSSDWPSSSVEPRRARSRAAPGR
jgi:hypothetical protein